MIIAKVENVPSLGVGFPDGNGPNFVVYQGITTAVGNVAGTTLIDDALALQPNYGRLAVWIQSGLCQGQVRPVLTHLGNTITIDGAAFDGQILAGVAYMILPFYTHP